MFVFSQRGSYCKIDFNGFLLTFLIETLFIESTHYKQNEITDMYFTYDCSAAAQ